MVLSLLVSAVGLFAGRAHAACPSALSDQLVPGTAWNSPSEGARGISLDSSYRMAGYQYILSAINPSSSTAVTLYRFYGSSHSQIGSAVTANTDTEINYRVDTVATWNDNANNWASVWDGYMDDGGRFGAWWQKFNENMYPLDSESLVFDSSLSQQGLPVIDALTGSGYYVIAGVGAYGALSRSRPFFTVVRPSGTVEISDTLVEYVYGWNVDTVAVDAFMSTSYGHLFVVAWRESYPSTTNTRIKFKVYNADGSLRAGTRTITASSGKALHDVRVARVGDKITLVWDSADTTDRLDSDSYMQAWPVVGTSPAYTSRLIDESAYYPTYMPDISAELWSNGTYTYDVYSTTYSRVLSGCGSSSGYCLYPTIHLFKSMSSPVDTTGAQLLSWYPQSYIDTFSDGCRTEVFTGCTGQVVIGGVDYADSDINPSTQRGLRRSFFAISASGVESSSSSMLLESAAELEALAGLGMIESSFSDPYSALNNDGHIVSDTLNDERGALAVAE